VSGTVRAVLHRTGTGQRLVHWITGEAAVKPVAAEQWIGSLVYYLIMLFVLIGFFQVVGLTIVTEPLVRMMNQIFQTVPALLGAGLFLLLAWVTASVLRFIVIRLLKATKSDESLRGIAALKNMQAAPSEIAGHLVRVAIMLFAAIEAARILGFVLLADLLVRFTVSAGHVLTGLVIFAVGLYIANLISNLVLASGMVQSEPTCRRRPSLYLSPGRGDGPETDGPGKRDYLHGLYPAPRGYRRDGGPGLWSWWKGRCGPGVRGLGAVCKIQEDIGALFREPQFDPNLNHCLL